MSCGELYIILGCGNTKREGWIGLDKGDYGQEIIRDMRKGLPFCDNSCCELFADQVLEHIQSNEDFIFVMNECLRVLKPKGRFEIFVPFYSDIVAYKDPTHCRYFTKETFSFLEPTNHWDYGFDKRWKVLTSELINVSQLHVILEANK